MMGEQKFFFMGFGSNDRYFSYPYGVKILLKFSSQDNS